jgi:transcriptional regulator with XRE-family HTH domain
MAKINNHPLAKYRADRQITQEALATELNVTPMTIWRWENDRRTPSRSDAARIATHTGIPVLEIMRMENSQ